MDLRVSLSLNLSCFRIQWFCDSDTSNCSSLHMNTYVTIHARLSSLKGYSYTKNKCKNNWYLCMWMWICLYLSKNGKGLRKWPLGGACFFELYLGGPRKKGLTLSFNWLRLNNFPLVWLRASGLRGAAMVALACLKSAPFCIFAGNLWLLTRAGFTRFRHILVLLQRQWNPIWLVTTNQVEFLQKKKLEKFLSKIPI